MIQQTSSPYPGMERSGLEELIQEAKKINMDPSTWEGAAKVIKNDESIGKNKPIYSVRNPLNDKLIVYCNSRLKRPDNHGKSSECQICNGITTPIILAGEDYPTPFINLNRFPYFHPNVTPLNEDDILIGGSFLEFLTTDHKEIHQISYEEHDSCLELMKQFENNLGTEIIYGNKEYSGNFSVFKNTGKEAGASLEHGHYQIAFTNGSTSSFKKDFWFLETKREAIAEHTLNRSKNNSNLIIQDYDSVQIIAPYFARTPLEAMIIPKNNIERVADLDDKTLKDLSRATLDLSRSLYHLMPGFGKPLAYNTVFHTGPIKRMYLQFSPLTQIHAGLEKVGIDACQLDPKTSAKIYRNVINKVSQNPNDYEISPNNEIATESFDKFIKPILN